MFPYRGIYLNFLGNGSSQCVVELLERDGTKVSELPACRGIMKIKDPKPWWPYLMTDNEPGLYFQGTLTSIMKMEV